MRDHTMRIQSTPFESNKNQKNRYWKKREEEEENME